MTASHRHHSAAKVVVFIAPALTDQAGQCQIYTTTAMSEGMAACDFYRAHPDLWRSAGIMSSRGKVVCYDGPAEQLLELRNSEPLAAGCTFTFDAVESVPA